MPPTQLRCIHIYGNAQPPSTLTPGPSPKMGEGCLLCLTALYLTALCLTGSPFPKLASSLT
jgi:hypothetical protein